MNKDDGTIITPYVCKNPVYDAILKYICDKVGYKCTLAGQNYYQFYSKHNSAEYAIKFNVDMDPSKLRISTFHYRSHICNAYSMNLSLENPNLFNEIDTFLEKHQ